MKKRLLLIEPHSDDGMIAVGGFLEKYRDDYEYHFLLMSASDVTSLDGSVVARTTRLTEYSAYVHHFGGVWHCGECGGYHIPLDADSKLDTIPQSTLVSIIENKIQEIRPDTLMVMGASSHVDHTAVFQATIAALRPTKNYCPSEVYILENFTYIHHVPGMVVEHMDTYIRLEGREVAKKIEMFKAMFPSQIRMDDPYDSGIGSRLEAWLRYRGLEARCDCAEAMKTYRRLL